MRRRLLSRVMLLCCLLLPVHANWISAQAVAVSPAPRADPATFPVYIPLVLRTVPFAMQEADEIFLPLVLTDGAESDHPVAVVPVVGPPVSLPAAINPDLNLAVRGYSATQAPLTLIDYGGETDGDPPQLAALFDPPRLPDFVAALRVFDWNWGCGGDGCLGEPIGWPPVTLLALRATAGETLHLPARHAEIYGGGFVALVLYADASRLTLKYGREDSPADGYLVHVEAVRVDPSIVRSYNEMDSAGRGELPALCNGDMIGWAAGDQLQVAVRDTGSFLDPRSRKDWWQGWGATGIQALMP